MLKLFVVAIISFITFGCSQSTNAQGNDLTIYFSQPASDWEREGLPIGNGAMGAVVTGEVQQEHIQFNEKTLWEGGPGSAGGYDFGWPEKPQTKALATVQKHIEEQGQITPEQAAELMGRDTKGYGHYQNFGELVLSHSIQGEVSDYRRELDLTNAVASVSFVVDGVKYKREYFASYPDGVLVARISADKPKAISMSLALALPENRTQKIEVSNNSISASGELYNNKLKYFTAVNLSADGGTLIRSEKGLQVKNANEVLLVWAATTDYQLSYPTYRGALKTEQVAARLEGAVKQGFEKLKTSHIVDYQALFERVTLNLDHKLPAKPTPELLDEYKGSYSAADKALEHLYFQFGRYLLISSSRAGSLPANLQGVWNNVQYPPWNADYHVNINLQMNYWPAEVTNLSETTAPLFDFVDALVEPGREAAKRIVGAKGWTLFLNTNIWGFTGVIKWPTAFWQPEAGAWLAQHYYEHYLFNKDIIFLQNRAYPIMREASIFWLDALVKNPKTGQWVVSPSFSPEQGPFVMGAAMSQQIVYDLFANTLSAAKLLGDVGFVKKLRPVLNNLDPGLRIGKWGQLQEWQQDIDDPKNQHRHVSHLFALHPGRQISIVNQPELANAAKTTLNGRGDGGTGWAQAWKINLWARLLDGNRAHKLLSEQLKHSTLPNLWDNHPPFQIDGNFGATAGVAEMLLQSHQNLVQLLPALPAGWPKGAVTGLKARGGLTVDIAWADKNLQKVTLLSDVGGTFQIQNDLFSSEFSIDGADSFTKVKALKNTIEVVLKPKTNVVITRK